MPQGLQDTHLIFQKLQLKILIKMCAELQSIRLVSLELVVVRRPNFLVHLMKIFQPKHRIKYFKSLVIYREARPEENWLFLKFCNL